MAKRKRTETSGVDMMMYQQGDVILYSCDRIPEGPRKMIANGILAYGEATGHKHQIEDYLPGIGLVEDDSTPILPQVEVLEILGRLYVKAKKEWILRHEEHRPITIPPGNYEVKIVQEYDHFAEEARKVAD